MTDAQRTLWRRWSGVCSGLVSLYLKRVFAGEFTVSGNWLALEGEVPPESARPQKSSILVHKIKDKVYALLLTFLQSTSILECFKDAIYPHRWISQCLWKGFIPWARWEGITCSYDVPTPSRFLPMQRPMAFLVSPLY